MHTHTETDIQAENNYPKLVRDKIPEVVERDGKTAETRIMTDRQEILGYLFAKLAEETAELVEAETPDHQKEELADVREVLDAIQRALEISPDEITNVQASKREERGGFSDNVLMLSKP
jgi:predicted house-cleaning noncanonical NTP pyrophosphatase (MazG superfamily)